MDALAEQMQRPEVQEQMQEVQALMQDKSFAEKVEKLRVRCWYEAWTLHARLSDYQTAQLEISCPSCAG